MENLKVIKGGLLIDGNGTPPIKNGALLIAGKTDNPTLVTYLGIIAIAIATINVVGGFMVTDRMLQMFRRKPGDDTN